MSRVLHLLGQSIGVISLGKKIVLIEGNRNSLDKQTYGGIVGQTYPELVLVPAGGRESISSFAKALDAVLTKTIWGVDFFMLCDGDAATGTTVITELEKKSSGRLRRLPRYHLENYFFDERVLAKVFEGIAEPDGSWLRSPEQIRVRLNEFAKIFLSYAVALRIAHRVRIGVGNVDIMPSGCADKDLETLKKVFEESRASEEKRVGSVLGSDVLEKMITEEYRSLAEICARADDEWKKHLPGRPILNKLASESKLEVGRLKRLYLQVARSFAPDPFEEVRAIFAEFAQWRNGQQR